LRTGIWEGSLRRLGVAGQVIWATSADILLDMVELAADVVASTWFLAERFIFEYRENIITVAKMMPPASKMYSMALWARSSDKNSSIIVVPCLLPRSIFFAEALI